MHQFVRIGTFAFVGGGSRVPQDVPPYAKALVHLGLDERDATFAALEQAYALGDVHLIYLPVDPKWNPYRSDVRFVDLLEKCGFPPGR